MDLSRQAQDTGGCAQPLDRQLDDYLWLTSLAAIEFLSWVEDSSKTLAAQVDHLRRQLSAERAHRVLEQVALRHKARAKFVDAGKMFFTPIGLEQATDQAVAAYKALRFPSDGTLADLCCGIGGDLLALARRGPVDGFDRDPVSAVFAQANLNTLPETGATAQVRCQDVANLDLNEYAAWHIDPDRRPTGRRTTRVELHEPTAEAIDGLLARNGHAAVKLAPAAQLPRSWSDVAELEWISRGRECRQLVAWFGRLAADAGLRRATVLGSDGNGLRTLVGQPGEACQAAKLLGRYIYEPDSAVLAARLEGNLAAEHDLAPVSPGVSYFTGDQRRHDRALACFEILEVLPLKLKTLKAWFRERGVGQLEIKQRGIDVQPERLRRDLALSGEQALTLLATRLGKCATAIVARRVNDT